MLLRARSVFRIANFQVAKGSARVSCRSRNLQEAFAGRIPLDLVDPYARPCMPLTKLHVLCVTCVLVLPKKKLVCRAFVNYDKNIDTGGIGSHT